MAWGSRALFETGALLLDSTIRIEYVTVAKAKDKLDDLDKHLMSVMFGFKSAEWPMTLEYQAKNVVTIIECLTKKLDVDLIAMYGDLSEHAHPNYLGMMAAFQHVAEAGNPIIRFVDAPLDREISVEALVWATAGANIGTTMTRYALEKQKKNAPAFRQLCEERITTTGRGRRECRILCRSDYLRGDGFPGRSAGRFDPVVAGRDWRNQSFFPVARMLRRHNGERSVPVCRVSSRSLHFR